MGIDINLLSKKRKVTGAKSTVSMIYLTLLVVFSGYFFVSVAIVTYNLFTLNRSLAQVNTETVLLSEEIRSKNEMVTKYVLAKNILDYYENIQKSKFQYKLYLDEVVEMMPSGVVLKNVDFATKGWISISSLLPSHVTLKAFESKVSREEMIKSTIFESAYIESVQRDKEGQYIVKMQFAIKKNG